MNMSPSLGSEFRWHAQVAFGSGQFWALVIVDFVMLVMRDVRITSNACTVHVPHECIIVPKDGVLGGRTV
jgi:hypothetical protein